jgi:hypothetical protein
MIYNYLAHKQGSTMPAEHTPEQNKTDQEVVNDGTDPVQYLPEGPQRPRWLDTIEDIVGPGTRPDRIYEDNNGNLHIIFRDHGFRHPDNEVI